MLMPDVNRVNVRLLVIQHTLSSVMTLQTCYILKVTAMHVAFSLLLNYVVYVLIFKPP